MSLDQDSRKRLQSWRAMLTRDNVVVDYDPEAEDGFCYVPREESDDDIIRRPARKTTQRRNADPR
ncbi:hypothetical protein ACFU93_34605 [Streptomyces sp. NPDC057611]|uniref:hypothetical protein n=1 Tax=Streptomyces sp. NPDC057611 TaxID=3346182 RepID=UPI0036C821F2